MTHSTGIRTKAVTSRIGMIPPVGRRLRSIPIAIGWALARISRRSRPGTVTGTRLDALEERTRNLATAHRDGLPPR